MSNPSKEFENQSLHLLNKSSNMDDLSKGEPFTKNDDTDLINKPGNVKEVKTYK